MQRKGPNTLSLQRAYVSGLETTEAAAKDCLRSLYNQLPSKSEMLLPQPQLEFVPVPAPVFQYELVNDRLEIPNPKETLAKKCALLSCNIRITSIEVKSVLWMSCFELLFPRMPSARLERRS